MERVVVSQFNFDPEGVKGEVNSGELVVEAAGYIPAKVQIERLLLAGQRLSDFRKGEFESDFYDPDDVEDAVNESSLDLVEADEMHRRLVESQEANRRRYEEAKTKAKEQAVKPVPESSGGKENVPEDLS